MNALVSLLFGCSFVGTLGFVALHAAAQAGHGGGAGERAALPSACAESLRDQANPATCLQASSVPVPGMLFPPPHDGGMNNFASGTRAFVGGGENSTASGTHSTIAGGHDNTASGSSSTAGGGSYNVASGSGATVGGGSYNLASGIASGFGTVGGGFSNKALADFSTIGGGINNEATGSMAVIGGGVDNAASGFGAAIGGGFLNMADGHRATVSGGYGNSAAGSYATVAGGANNSAAALYSFAAGRRARAEHQGAFVWGDAQDVDKTSSTDDEFSVYAEGGTRVFAEGTANPALVVDSAGNVGIGTSAPGFLFEVNGSAGKPGGGAWSVASDARVKKNVRSLEGALAKLLALRGVTFEYEDPAAIHELPGERVGFVAQEVEPVIPDWVEESADGMKRLSIRGFEALAVEALRELQGENRALAERLAAQDAELESLRERLERLEAR